MPPHRRPAGDGTPTEQQLAARLAEATAGTAGLLAVDRLEQGDTIGYCGLTVPERGGADAELAFELLRRTWGRGYATEAATAVVAAARVAGRDRLTATAWDWNTPSRRVLGRLGFVELGQVEDAHGVTITAALDLRTPAEDRESGGVTR